ncbi:MAG: hypothetical protein Ct9H90mP7_4600 [Candidatus Neomarinimicrobiota bacterium]|nr:MAG: hypothetical protein Ct9H90mP7_4600 [Candidatus Neomarinimicrobiota bacterium]
MLRKEKEYAFEMVFFGNFFKSNNMPPFLFTSFNGTVANDWLIIFGLGVIQLGLPIYCIQIAFVMYMRSMHLSKYD